MRFKIRGQPFALKFTPESAMGDNDGDCGPPRTDGKVRRIRIRDNLPEAKELEIIIHELWHGAVWDLDEETITRSARDVAKVLWRLGWRKTGNQGGSK
jgi:hypothetical protein